MNRKHLLTNLVKVRDRELKGHSADLREQSGKLSQVQAIDKQITATASETLATPNRLRDLGALGAIKLDCAKRTKQISEQVRVLSTKVSRSRKRADQAREARAEFYRQLDAERERSLEAESEHFFAWKNGKPER